MTTPHNNARESTSGTCLQELTTWFQSPPISSARNPIARYGLPPANGKCVKDFAAFLLRVGAEIEHSLSVQYLYSAYSIDELAPNSEQNVALQWKTAIRLIAREEMAHLMTVQNLLLVLGEPFCLDRAPIHQDEKALAVPFKLERLSLKSLAKYVLAESPSEEQIPRGMKSAVTEADALVTNSHPIPKVGVIYAALYWLFLESDDPGETWPFPSGVVSSFIDEYGDNFHLEASDLDASRSYAEKAASPEEWGIFESGTRVDEGLPRDRALASLRWIMTQGEGPNTIEDSHFHRFVRIFEKFGKMGSAARDMVMKVADNPFVDRSNVTSGTPIKAPRSKRWAELLNLRYELMLLDVLDSLNSARSTHARQRQVFAEWASIEMEFVKKIGQLLPRLPLNMDDDGQVAGAPFQIAILPRTCADRMQAREKLLARALRLEGEAGHMTASESKDATLAVEPSLVASIAAHDDLMRRSFDVDPSV